ncbi:uncharacterized protein HKW66_Vig0147730 [Vigna angularis]|uniref:Uncharacterized protein n=1 Tax=Phaseolus angularis TaxID=3914 RepID=A0A8T0JYT7_PHAAN|nr:uncharacterized protein HKW66_Vig0147730 [Vigna angularis]
MSQSSVQGSLKPNSEMSLREEFEQRFEQRDKEISELKDMISQLLINQDKKKERSSHRRREESSSSPSEIEQNRFIKLEEAAASIAFEHMKRETWREKLAAKAIKKTQLGQLSRVLLSWKKNSELVLFTCAAEACLELKQIVTLELCPNAEKYIPILHSALESKLLAISSFSLKLPSII